MYVGGIVISTVCVIVDKVLNTHVITCSTELKGKRALDDKDMTMEETDPTKI